MTIYLQGFWKKVFLLIELLVEILLKIQSKAILFFPETLYEHELKFLFAFMWWNGKELSESEWSRMGYLTVPSIVLHIVLFLIYYFSRLIYIESQECNMKFTLFW